MTDDFSLKILALCRGTPKPPRDAVEQIGFAGAGFRKQHDNLFTLQQFGLGYGPVLAGQSP